MNDIRVLLNSVYTREYVLESLRQDQQISTKDSLGADQIKAFLQAVVQMLVTSHSSLPQAGAKPASPAVLKLRQQIANLAKLVLNQFIAQDKVLIRQTETQRILQEMLLDIVVQQLEDKCYTKLADGTIVPKTQRKRY